MKAQQSEIDTYITDIRSAIADFGDSVATKQRLGKTDIRCDKLKLMLLSICLDCLSDYFLQYQDPDEVDPDTTNFFTTSEIRDIMQHVNNMCKTNYIIVNL
jgi:hypothetical protein